MTTKALSEKRVTAASRELSTLIFGREHQLEVALAADGLSSGFVVDDLIDAVKAAATEADLETPKRNGVRANLDRLVEAGAIERLPSLRRGSPAHYTPVARSAFWTFAAELYDRT